MDTLAPPLKALLNIRLKIRSGNSVRDSIKEYVEETPDCDFSKNLGLWIFQMESEQEISVVFKKNYRKLLVDVLYRGLQGEQILKSLEALEEEMIDATEMDLEKQLQKLPFIVLIPLFFLQLPAFLLLLFGPLVLYLIGYIQ